MKKKDIILFPIFFISFSSLLTEILLTRVFSVTLGYHFAFFVISLVMFGLSFGGTIVFIFEKYFLKFDFKKILSVVCCLIPLSFIPIIFIVPKINFSLYFNFAVFPKILILFVICQLPFFFIGSLFSYLFFQLKNMSGKIYFFDLVGASFGAILSVFIINYFGGINGLIFAGLVSSIAFVITSLTYKSKKKVFIFPY
jgi:hypothetical protein